MCRALRLECDDVDDPITGVPVPAFPALILCAVRNTG
jgi:hypothetical protein